MKTRLIQLLPLCALLLLTLGYQVFVKPAAAAEPGLTSPSSQPAAAPAVTLQAASGATIPFETQNGKTVGNVPPQRLKVPHLVLYRNGALSDPDERTLIVQVSGIEVPPRGVTVTLELETQHGDPDHGDHYDHVLFRGQERVEKVDSGFRAFFRHFTGDCGQKAELTFWRQIAQNSPSKHFVYDQRIAVWQESRRIANTAGVTTTGVTAVFTHEFSGSIASGGGTIATPTDYFRYDVTVSDANHPANDPLHVFSADHALLMENQWIARLPEVREERAGAAPDELVVYYCDMFPFRKSPLDPDPATWLPREGVTDYVGTELVPHMVEAYRVQTDEWGFPWYDAWTSYRPDEPERLTVALSDGQTWFHSWAPSRGHSGISIRVKGGDNAAYDTLTDGLMSNFHHELFHNLQRNIQLHGSGNGDVDGKDDAWRFFSEGTAVLASSVGQPRGQFSQTVWAQDYMYYASNFVLLGGGRSRDLNTSYSEIDPYQAGLYWRFLYEQCGGMMDGVEDPAAGMRVIGDALRALYSGDIVDICSSTDLVGAVPQIMDQALAGSSCPFQTYEESLTAFASAVFGLRLDCSGCAEPGAPGGCGFYDPYNQYRDPPSARSLLPG